MRSILSFFFRSTKPAEEPQIKEVVLNINELIAALKPLLEPQDAREGKNPLITSIEKANDWLLASEYKDRNSDRFKRAMTSLKDIIQEALSQKENSVIVPVNLLEEIAQTITVVDNAAAHIYETQNNQTEFFHGEFGLEISECEDKLMIDPALSALFSPQAQSKTSLEVREKLMQFAITLRHLLIQNNISFKQPSANSNNNDLFESKPNQFDPWDLG